jgi:signal transduction histidine kinase
MLVRIVATEREHIDGYRHFLHDLFNYCGVLNTGLVRARKAQQPVDPLIVDAADGLNGLSRRFRETNGHTQAGPLPVVNLGEMLSKVCSRMDGTIPTTVECPPDLRERDVHADKVAIETALLNLAVNARQAGAQRVVLTVEEVGNSTVSLVVRDDGRGIPPELTDLLFRQPVKSRQGLGVGLLAVRENLAFCGAEIHLTDANAEGGAHTTFTISGLKLASDQPPSAAAAD